MNLFIDNKSGAPIYEQLYTQIKNQILSGELQPEEAMPSIRGLARDLRISVITTKRAYDELEQEGFLYAVPAKGFFVAAKNTELLREENLKKIEEHRAAPGREPEKNRSTPDGSRPAGGTLRADQTGTDRNVGIAVGGMNHERIRTARP